MPVMVMLGSVRSGNEKHAKRLFCSTAKTESLVTRPPRRNSRQTRHGSDQSGRINSIHPSRHIIILLSLNLFQSPGATATILEWVFCGLVLHLVPF